MFRTYLTEVGQISGLSLPTHVPITAKFNLEPSPMSILVQPTPLPPLKDAEYGQLDQQFIVCQQTLEDLLMRGYLTEAYTLWSFFWENWYICRLGGDFDRPAFRGRGQGLRVKSVHPRSPKRPAHRAMPCLSEIAVQRWTYCRSFAGQNPLPDPEDDGQVWATTSAG